MPGGTEPLLNPRISLALRALNEQIAAAAESFEQMCSGIRAMLDWPKVRDGIQQFSAFTDSLRKIDAEKLKLISEGMKAAQDTILKAELLGEYGWTLPMMMTPWQLRRILALNDPALIDAAFVDFYSAEEGLQYRRLQEYLLSSPDLQRWRGLLLQCCGAYERAEHLIVVPSLLTVLEGAIAIPNKARFVSGRDRASFFDAMIADAAADSVEQYMWRSVNAFVEGLFERSDFFASPVPERLNRHWILHGRDVPDWDASDCLRLFQAIGTVTRLG